MPVHVGMCGNMFFPAVIMLVFCASFGALRCRITVALVSVAQMMIVFHLVLSFFFFVQIAVPPVWWDGVSVCGGAGCAVAVVLLARARGSRGRGWRSRVGGGGWSSPLG